MGVAAVVISGLTLAGTLVLKQAQLQAAISLKREQAQVRAIDLYNPTTWGNIAVNVREVPEALGAFIRFQAITALLFLVAVGGSLLSAYLIWRDYFGGPRVTQIARQAAALTPAGQAAQAAETAAEAIAPIARPHNPKVTFARGKTARAVRDVLAKHIARSGGAREPHAVATETIKRLGVAKVKRSLPKREVAKELVEQKAEVAA